MGDGDLMKRFSCKFVFLGTLLGLLSGCGKAPSKPYAGTVASGQIDPITGQPISDDGSPAASVSDLPMDASLAAFEAYVYGPILSQYCANCHAETFAPKAHEMGPDGTLVASDDELAKAHSAFLARANFDAFAGVDQTLPVTKMDYKNGGHNCWEAEPKKCYDKMVEAINLWLGELETAGYKPKPVQYPNATEGVMLSTAAPVSVTVDATSYFVGSAEKLAALTAPWQMMKDDVDGPITSYITPAAGTAPAGNAAQAATAQIFNMDIKAAGTYYVWARIKTPAGNMSRFFVGANGANGVVQTPGQTTTWKWVQIMQGNANNRVPMQFTLAAAPAAPVPMRVFLGDPGVKINTLVVTSRKDDFNGEQISNQYFDVKVPLKVAGADGAMIVATVWKMTDGEGKKSIGVKELRIESAVPLKVKNIKPLINDLYFSNHGTYTIVDTVAGGSDPVIKTGGATSSIWLADLEKDKLSFSFEVLEVAK